MFDVPKSSGGDDDTTRYLCAKKKAKNKLERSTCGQIHHSAAASGATWTRTRNVLGIIRRNTGGNSEIESGRWRGTGVCRHMV